MAATTPSGWRIIISSMPRATSSSCSLASSWNAAGDFDVLDGAAHFGFGFGERLAVFLGEDAADVIEVIFEQHLQLEERLDAVFWRSAAPFGESRGRSFDGAVHFGGVG